MKTTATRWPLNEGLSMNPAPLFPPVEPLLSANKARVVLAQLKGLKKIDAKTLAHLVLKEGLPKVTDPFGSGRWCFFESAINAWFTARTKSEQPSPMRGPGRPPNSTIPPAQRR